MENLFNSILMASFWGSCLTVLFLVINTLFKKSLPVSWHYYIWIIVLIRLSIPTFITVSIETKKIPFATQMQGAFDANLIQHDLDVPSHFAGIPTQEVDATKFVRHENLFVASEPYVPLINRLFNVSNLWIVWFIVAVAIVFYKFISYLFYIKKLKLCNIYPRQDEINVFSDQARELKINKKLSFYKNNDISSPLAIGFFKSMVILPNREYKDTQLIYIFRHELTHIKRHDIVLKWFFETVRSIHWFNPFIYIATKTASFYCEISCDEEVLKYSMINERKEYSMTIIDVISQAISPKIPMCVSMNNSKSDLKKRINFILNNEQKKRSIASTIAITIMTLALCACSSVKYEGETLISQPLEAVAANRTSKDDSTEKTSTPIKMITNLLIAGIDGDGGISDRSGCSDVIIIASFNSETNKISLISIPRDTYLSPSEETISKLSQQGISIPKEIKFGEITAYAEGENEMNFLQAELSNMLSIPIDYYIKMDMPAFKKVVDAVGGVEMTIPKGGLYYSDTTQNLEIAIKGGTQLLDGDLALQLVRYRSTYRNGDLERISVQQQLIKELFKKTLDTNNLLEKSTALFSILTENTETNMTLNDLASYMQFITKIEISNLQLFVLPGENNVIDKRSYLIMNKEEFDHSLSSVFR